MNTGCWDSTGAMPQKLCCAVTHNLSGVCAGELCCNLCELAMGQVCWSHLPVVSFWRRVVKERSHMHQGTQRVIARCSSLALQGGGANCSS